MKTITAGSMAEALATVKREVGPDAVIVHTRTYRRGGLFFGFGARTVVEITAKEDDRRIARRKRLARRDSVGEPVAGAARPVVETQTAGDLIRRTYLAARQGELLPATAAPTSASAALSATVVAAATAAATPVAPVAARAAVREPAAAEELCREMACVRRMVERVMQMQTQQKTPPQLPDSLFDHYLALLKQDVTEELAQQIIEQVQGQLTPLQWEDQHAVREAARNAIASRFPADDAMTKPAPTADGRPRTIALVGPTGVGKTTTIAKLAATFKLKQARHVGMITLDTYRIAAVDQLRTYADIIGIPLHVVATPAEMDAALNKCRGCETILIDTAGRSQRDDPKLDQLRHFMSVARPHETHLVLSSICTQSVMLDAVERFSIVGIDKIIFTKLDEAVSFGVLLNVAQRVGKQLSYITTGQEVPHQIEPSRGDRLADLVLGGTLS
ncbi:MAG: flagellar biosynthesis protein FlhF [Phycisphaeraceae bacterium]|nr:flagellar biosynthesis protein FlhF [Phycisphaeraceae bacterium]